jgi:hypothetical protein
VVAKRFPPGRVSFLEYLEALGARRQDAHRHSILKADYIFSEGRIELEFRQ